MLTWISNLFGCRHIRFSFPQRSKIDGKDYVVCLGCGLSHEYEIGVGLISTRTTMEETHDEEEDSITA